MLLRIIEIGSHCKREWVILRISVSTLDVGEKAAILTSGKSDNPMDKHPDENYLRYNLL